MFEELRKKSKGTKEAYAFWGAAIFTAIVGLIWVVSLPVRFSSVDPLGEIEQQADTSSAFSQFFGQLRENVGATWQQSEEALSGLSEEQNEEEPAAEEPTLSSSTPSIIIATSSSRSILIGTSTKPNQ